ncbi:MAG: TMEM175 family protein [Telluria sp.]
MDGFHLSKHRIEALTDGIFAVAMTLLVIDLHVPEHLDISVAAALAEQFPKLVSWLISFLVLAIFWIANHRMYSHVREVDTSLLWLTIGKLGGASLMPFAAMLSSQHQSLAAQTVYAAVLCWMSLVSMLTWRYLHRHPQLCSHPVTAAHYRAAFVRVWGFTVIAVLSVLLFPWLHGMANFVFMLNFTLRHLGERSARKLEQAPVQ